MKIFFRPLLYIVFACLFSVIDEKSQGQTSNSTLSLSTIEKSLFESDEILHIKLIGNVRELVSDRNGDPKPFPFILSYATNKGTEVSLEIQARTRGHFRRTMGNCTYPPLLLQFSKSNI